MITAATLKSKTVKELAEMAKKKNVDGWHSMRKDELVKAIVRKLQATRRKRARAAEQKAQAKPTRPATAAKRRTSVAAKNTTKRSAAKKKATTAKAASPKNAATRAKAPAVKKRPEVKKAEVKKPEVKKKPQGNKAEIKKKPEVQKAATKKRAEVKKPEVKKNGASVQVTATNGRPKPAQQNGHAATKTRPKSAAKIRAVQDERSAKMDLAATPKANGNAPNGKPGRARKRVSKAFFKNGKAGKDRVVLLVRDSYWLQACWDVSGPSVERAKAAMAEQWHTARPTLRVFEVEAGATTSSSERILRDIEIHGGVRNWYIDVSNPPSSYRVEIGYHASNGRFYSLSRSNVVTTPMPGSSDSIDDNWTDIADDYQRYYALSGGYSDDGSTGELQQLFEERLRRPMEAPAAIRYGLGAERSLNRQRDLLFEVDAELIVYGRTRPGAHLTMNGEPIKMNPDGSFSVRQPMPDRRQVIPVTASSIDGIEQRTVVLAVERNTKVMEPITREVNETS